MSIEVFSHIVRELTGDWIAPIECMKIQEEERFFHDEVVFFGKLEELGPTGKVHALQEASMLDKYKFDQQRAGFFFIEDPECRKIRSLEEDKQYIVWYNGASSIPYIIEIQDEPITTHRLMFETT